MRESAPQEIKKCIETDVYWGEFSEAKMDVVLEHCKKSGLGVARIFLRSLGREEFVFGRMRSDFLYYFDLSRNSTCLDCGCGLGVHTFNLARYAGEVHAFDQSLRRLQFVAERAKAEGVKNIHLYHSDFARLPFQENTFDVIVMNGVVEWLGEIGAHDNPRDDQITVLQQMYKLLKPGGVLYIGIENRWAAAYLRGRDHNDLRFTNFMPRPLANLVTLWRLKKPYRTYTYGRRGYRRLLEISGFKNSNVTFATAYPGYNTPQFIMPFDDIAALSFFLRNFSGGKGLKGRVVAFLARFPFAVRMMRYFFWSFAIFARKET